MLPNNLTFRALHDPKTGVDHQCTCSVQSRKGHGLSLMWPCTDVTRQHLPGPSLQLPIRCSCIDSIHLTIHPFLTFSLNYWKKDWNQQPATQANFNWKGKWLQLLLCPANLLSGSTGEFQTLCKIFNKAHSWTPCSGKPLPIPQHSQICPLLENTQGRFHMTRDKC